MTLAPRSLAELQEAVAASAPAPLRIRGGGSKRPPPAEGTTLDLRQLSGVVAYNPAECVITVLGGTRVADVERVLGEHGQYLPFDPPLLDAGATIGGMVAAGLSGPGRYRYGGIRDFVIGAAVVDGEGRLIRSGGQVVKNAAGFLLHHALVGSAGRYGAIGEMSFKVFPRPEARATVASGAGELGRGDRCARAAAGRARSGSARSRRGHPHRLGPGGGAGLQPAGAAVADPRRGERARRHASSPPTRNCAPGTTPPSSRWAAPDAPLIKLVATPSLLRHAAVMAPAAGRARVTCGGAAVLWSPAMPMADAPAALGEGWRGVVVRGPECGRLIASTAPDGDSFRGGSRLFDERVRRVLDPHARFTRGRTMQHRLPVDALGPDGPAMAVAVSSCVHCGFCLPACPTYAVLGEEMDSPRGRIVLMKEALEGTLPLADAAVHLDRCLGCLACETACPSGVRYRDLIEPVRERLAAARPAWRRAATSRLLNVMESRDRFRRALRLGRLARPVSAVLPATLRAMLSLLPATSPSRGPPGGRDASRGPPPRTGGAAARLRAGRAAPVDHRGGDPRAVARGLRRGGAGRPRLLRRAGGPLRPAGPRRAPGRRLPAGDSRRGRRPGRHRRRVRVVAEGHRERRGRRRQPSTSPSSSPRARPAPARYELPAPRQGGVPGRLPPAACPGQQRRTAALARPRAPPDAGPDPGRRHVLRVGRALQPRAAGDCRGARRAQGRRTGRVGSAIVATGNIGCLTQLEKALAEAGAAIRLRHTIELLAEALVPGGQISEDR